MASGALDHARATLRQAAAKAIVTKFTFMKTVEIVDQARVTYLYFETFLTEFYFHLKFYFSPFLSGKRLNKCFFIVNH